MSKSPHQRHRIQIADGAHAGFAGGKGRRIQTLILSLEACLGVPKGTNPKMAKHALVRMVHSSVYLLWYLR